MNTRSRSANRCAAPQRERNRQQDRDRRAGARRQQSDQHNETTHHTSPTGQVDYQFFC